MIVSSEVHVLDRNAGYHGVPTDVLMENAGRHVADFVQSQFDNPNVLVLCGTGNNGGDGFVAARYLIKKYPVDVVLLGLEKEIRGSIARMNFEKMKNLPISIYDIRHLKQIPELIKRSTVILDAMLGIGISGALREPYGHVVELLDTVCGKTIIAVDVPTGFGNKPCVHPHYCITFHDLKEGMNQASCGEILIADIGIPKEASLYVGPGELVEYYPKSKKSSHKGENGRVLVVGGGPFFGAPVLSGLAALRTGADLVYIASPKQSAGIISGYSPNFIVYPLVNNDKLTKDDVLDIIKNTERADSVVVGPGLGTAQETMQAIPMVVSEILRMGRSLVLDADGLKAMTNYHDILKHSPTVITPHCGEFEMFTGKGLPDDVDKRKEIVTSWAKALDITIVLKGPVDIISDGKSTKLNIVHNEAMTVVGPGDVLAGVIGALLSKKATPFNAARIAAFLNGEAGNYAFSTKSYGLLATDVIEEIPSVLKRYL